MPQTKQAMKALKKSQKKAEQNKIVKNTIKTLVKKSHQAIDKKDAKAEELIKQSIQKIDKAMQKGVIKKNTGARKKSRLVKALNKKK